jgi:DNA polymerase-3 subunit delta
MAAKKGQTAEGTRAIYVIAGKDDFLVGSQCQALLDKLMAPEDRQMGLFDADPEQATAVGVFDELRTLPFLTERRVVLIRGADDFISDNREAFEKYFDNPSRCGILVMTVKTWLKTTKLAKKLDTAGELIGVAEMAEAQLPQYVVDLAAKQGKTIARAVAQTLVDLVGDEPGRLSSEVDKLVLLAAGNKTITPANVEALVGNNRIYDAFNVLDSLTAGDNAGAIDKLRRMFAADKGAEYTVVGAFAYTFRRMFGAKALLSKGVNQAQAAAKCRVWKDKDAFFRQLAKFKLEEIGALLQELAGIDHGIKTGQVTAATAMEQFVVKLTRPR